MAWVAVDRAIRSAEAFDWPGDLRTRKRLRAEIHADVCRHGFDAERGTFTRSYDSRTLDSSLLLIPLVGFLPPHDQRVQATIRAIEDELLHHGFLRRYDTDDPDADGLSGEKGPSCPAPSGWPMPTSRAAARRTLAGSSSGCSPSPMMSACWRRNTTPSPNGCWNFPQAFSHIALVNTASNLAGGGGTTEHRTE